MSKNDANDDKSLSERIETIVDESKEAFKQAYQSSASNLSARTSKKRLTARYHAERTWSWFA